MRIKRKIRRDIQFAKSMTLPQWIIGLILLFGLIFVLVLIPYRDGTISKEDAEPALFISGFVLLVSFLVLLICASANKRRKAANVRSGNRTGSQNRTAVAPFHKRYNPSVIRDMNTVDAMDGLEFESFCAELLRHLGYENVDVTKASGDQGIDVLASKGKTRYGIQCKRQTSSVSNKAVQEAFTGRTFYNCNRAVVMTNNYFTDSAVDLARKCNVELWDRDDILAMLAAFDDT